MKGIKINDSMRFFMVVFSLIGIFLVGGFLGYQFIKIDKQGLYCLKDPLNYAEEKMTELKGEQYQCSCTDNFMDFQELNLSQNWIINP